MVEEKSKKEIKSFSQKICSLVNGRKKKIEKKKPSLLAGKIFFDNGIALLKGPRKYIEKN